MMRQFVQKGDEMKNIGLSRRLAAVSRFVLPGSIVCDIGTDHAYLPIHIIRTGKAAKVIATEAAQGPFERAGKNVREAGLEGKIELRKGDGLSVIDEQDQIGCITVAGMGGTLIANILEAGKDRLNGVKRLVVQPNVGARKVREWFLQNGWELIGEEILEEDGQFYEILAAEKGDPYRPYRHLQKELLFGPFLLREKSPAFREKWRREKGDWEAVSDRLRFVKETASVREKKRELAQYIRWYEEEFPDETSDGSRCCPPDGELRPEELRDGRG
ncbi:hypothetical protein B4135_1255 [Caldibacillus debilis]|uniref:SAM-dependent methyltransferase n=2 Tax=Caldibacillus debilis TaxID=301148 RepID=A0A150MDS5_9BACI|nr:hypothetical protein B4135_1255 [Caldibacillus debilis]